MMKDNTNHVNEKRNIESIQCVNNDTMTRKIADMLLDITKDSNKIPKNVFIEAYWIYNKESKN